MFDLKDLFPLINVKYRGPSETLQLRSHSSFNSKYLFPYSLWITGVQVTCLRFRMHSRYSIESSCRHAQLWVPPFSGGRAWGLRITSLGGPLGLPVPSLNAKCPCPGDMLRTCNLCRLRVISLIQLSTYSLTHLEEALHWIRLIYLLPHSIGSTAFHETTNPPTREECRCHAWGFGSRSACFLGQFWVLRCG